MTYKTVFFGTPEFSVSSLQVLHENPDFDVVAVVSMPDRPAGRGKKLATPPVAAYAKDNDLMLFQSENINREESFLKFIESQKIDLMIVIAFAQFLGKKILDSSIFGAYNIHTSLLPKYRGAAPIQYALLNGDQVTGVSIQKMVREMDAGDICYEHSVPIRDDDTSATLFSRLQEEAAQGLKNFLNIFKESEGLLSFTKQDENLVSFAPTIQKADGLINPFNENPAAIINKLRAYTPWPGCFLFLSGMRLKVIDIEKYPETLAPGELNTVMGALVLGTKNGAIRLKTIQPEGKKPQADSDFLNGIKSKGITLKLDRDHYE